MHPGRLGHRRTWDHVTMTVVHGCRACLLHKATEVMGWEVVVGRPHEMITGQEAVWLLIHTVTFHLMISMINTIHMISTVVVIDLC